MTSTPPPRYFDDRSGEFPISGFSPLKPMAALFLAVRSLAKIESSYESSGKRIIAEL